MDFSSSNFAVALLGLLAATGLFAWHSHIHMEMILIPPITYLITQKQLPYSVLSYWVFVPAAIYASTFFLAALTQAGVMPSNIGELLDFLRGASGFGANGLLLVWAIKNFSFQ